MPQPCVRCGAAEMPTSPCTAYYVMAVSGTVADKRALAGLVVRTASRHVITDPPNFVSFRKLPNLRQIC